MLSYMACISDELTITHRVYTAKSTKPAAPQLYHSSPGSAIQTPAMIHEEPFLPCPLPEEGTSIQNTRWGELISQASLRSGILNSEAFLGSLQPSSFISQSAVSAKLIADRLTLGITEDD